jgi:hypothetical protein
MTYASVTVDVDLCEFDDSDVLYRAAAIISAMRGNERRQKLLSDEIKRVSAAITKLYAQPDEHGEPLSSAAFVRTPEDIQRALNGPVGWRPQA